MNRSLKKTFPFEVVRKLKCKEDQQRRRRQRRRRRRRRRLIFYIKPQLKFKPLKTIFLYNLTLQRQLGILLKVLVLMINIFEHKNIFKNIFF